MPLRVTPGSHSCSFNGYNQIKMDPSDIEETAFLAPMDNFYYTVMLFGLKHAGATY